jgi:hypothetical protein
MPLEAFFRNSVLLRHEIARHMGQSLDQRRPTNAPKELMGPEKSSASKGPLPYFPRDSH